jgi:hypothetical protein
MRRLATLVVVAVLMSPMTASGQNYTFGDWAKDHGYSPGDVMPSTVTASRSSPAIDDLSGIGRFDWTTTPTETLNLTSNNISSIEPSDFSELTNLTGLYLFFNRLSSIEPGDFSGLTSLMWLNLESNQISSIEAGAFCEQVNLEDLSLRDNATLTALNLEAADFSNLTSFDVYGNESITSVSLTNTVVNQISLAALMDGGGCLEDGRWRARRHHRNGP